MTGQDRKPDDDQAAERGRSGYPDDAYAGGTASGQKRGLHQPDDDQYVEDALKTVRLRDSGATVEDRLGDSRGKGVRGGFDDATDGTSGQVDDEQVARSPRDT